MRKDQELTARQKAAVLLISLGPESASKVYKHLSEEEIEALTMEITGVRNVNSEQIDEVIQEFHEIAIDQKYISQGGVDYAKAVLEKALGEEEASQIINRLQSTMQVRPFDFARKADPSQILNFIQNEHPQTIALVLSYLDPEKAGQILSELPNDTQADIARRIAVMDRTSPDVIKEVESILERKLSATVTNDYSQSGELILWWRSFKVLGVQPRKPFLMRLAFKIPNWRKKLKSGCLCLKISSHSMTALFRES